MFGSLKSDDKIILHFKTWGMNKRENSATLNEMLFGNKKIHIIHNNDNNNAHTIFASCITDAER